MAWIRAWLAKRLNKLESELAQFGGQVCVQILAEEYTIDGMAFYEVWTVSALKTDG